MMTGRCILAAYYCPYCGHIHGGQALGGIEKRCERCGFKGLCDIKQEVEDGEVRAYEEICAKCLINVLEKLVGGGPYYL